MAKISEQKILDVWKEIGPDIQKERNWRNSTYRQYDSNIHSFAEDLTTPLENLSYSEVEHYCKDTITKRNPEVTINVLRIRMIIIHDIFLYCSNKGYVNNIFLFSGYKQLQSAIRSIRGDIVIPKGSRTSRVLAMAKKKTRNTKPTSKPQKSIDGSKAVLLANYLARLAPEGDGQLLGIAICLYAGPRPAECRALTFGDLIAFADKPERNCLVIEKIRTPNGEISPIVKTASSFRKIPVHIELNTLLQLRMAHILKNVAPGTDISKFPIVCDGHNYNEYCSASNFAYCANKVLNKYLNQAFIDYCFESARELNIAEENEAKDCYSLYCLRRNFMSSLNALTCLDADEKKYCMGHMNRNVHREDQNMLYADEDKRILILNKLDQWVLNRKMHQPLFEYQITDTSIILKIYNASFQRFKIPAKLLNTPKALQLIIHKKHPQGQTKIVQASNPKHFKTPPTYTITTSATEPEDPLGLPRPNRQKAQLDFIDKVGKRP